MVALSVAKDQLFRRLPYFRTGVAASWIFGNLRHRVVTLEIELERSR